MNTQEPQTYPRLENHLLAIGSLALSILGLSPVLPIIGSVAGLVTGYIARKEIRAQPERYTGAGMAKAGIILGWVGIGLLVIACAGFLLYAPLVFPVRSFGSGPILSGTPVPVITVPAVTVTP